MRSEGRACLADVLSDGETGAAREPGFVLDAQRRDYKTGQCGLLVLRS